MNEFFTARYRTLESISDIIGSHNPNQTSSRTRNSKNSPQENQEIENDSDHYYTPEEMSTMFR